LQKVIVFTLFLFRAACLELLPSYPGQDFVILTLQTLTNLAKQTLIHIPDQVTELYKYPYSVAGSGSRSGSWTQQTLSPTWPNRPSSTSLTRCQFFQVSYFRDGSEFQSRILDPADTLTNLAKQTLICILNHVAGCKLLRH
jgi:hypothetical protein